MSNMHNMQDISKIMQEMCKRYAKYRINMQQICTICKIYARNMLEICKKYAPHMQQICKLYTKYAKYAKCMQNVCHNM